MEWRGITDDVQQNSGQGRPEGGAAGRPDWLGLGKRKKIKGDRRRDKRGRVERETCEAVVVAGYVKRTSAGGLLWRWEERSLVPEACLLCLATRILLGRGHRHPRPSIGGSRCRTPKHTLRDLSVPTHTSCPPSPPPGAPIKGVVSSARAVSARPSATLTESLNERAAAPTRVVIAPNPAPS